MQKREFLRLLKGNLPNNMGYSVYTGGTFDLFHIGHLNFLRGCAKLGSVVVSLNTDAFIRTYKGHDPVYPYEERKKILESCVFVTRVIENTGGADSRPAIESIHPDFLVIGSDWAKKDYYAQMHITQKWLDDRGILLIYLPYTDHISSTLIRKRLAI